MNYQELKDKQRALRSGFPDSMGLRVHRAISWLHKAELSSDDSDAHFIFLWIAFNSAYAQSLDHTRFSEQETFQQFIAKLCALDKQDKIYQLLWTEFTSSIRLLVKNQYVFQPFWDAQNADEPNDDWKTKFQSASNRANQALAENDSPVLLSIILSRLYTLRNQIIHGGSTWNSSANREQLRDGVNFLSKLVPILIDIMLDNPNELWGDAHYPVVS